MADSKAKGAAGEKQVKELLIKHTGHAWERVPHSGALEYLKGDLYIPEVKMRYCVEVKFYKESSINHLIVHGQPPLFGWWNQAVTQSRDKIPVLFFKHNRSKIYVMVEDMPLHVSNFVFINQLSASILLAEDWLTLEKPEWF